MTRVFATLLMSFCLLAAQMGPVWAACHPQPAGKSAEMPCHSAEEEPSSLPDMPCCGEDCHCPQGLVMSLPLSPAALSEPLAGWVIALTPTPLQSVILPIPTSPPKLLLA